MLILALDTATEKGSVALVAENRLLGEFFLNSPGTYLTRLLPAVEALFNATGRRVAELGAIAVSQGPGNFTGLRIGLATAKSLAWALGCPLVPVPTLEVLAAQLPYQPHPVAVLMDAKRQEVYLGLFSCREAQPRSLADPIRVAAAALPPYLLPPLLLTGPGLTAYRESLKGLLSPDLTWAPEEWRYPRASTVARLGRGRLGQGLTVAPEKLTPTYLRAAL
jgi:tRNA threonylcarbamoyladenosine biosynthesis protein TsaB